MWGNSNIKLKNLLLAVGWCECRSLDLLAFECVAVTEDDCTELLVVEMAVAVEVVLDSTLIDRGVRALRLARPAVNALGRDDRRHVK